MVIKWWDFVLKEILIPGRFSFFCIFTLFQAGAQNLLTKIHIKTGKFHFNTITLVNYGVFRKNSFINFISLYAVLNFGPYSFLKESGPAILGHFFIKEKNNSKVKW